MSHVVGSNRYLNKRGQPTSKAKTSQVVLSLLVMGEVGRFMYVASRPRCRTLGADSGGHSDMSPQHDIFNFAIERFSAEQEEVRAAAAFATGTCSVLS